jgi:hypothetical protein
MHSHFGFDDVEANCGSCDVCVAAASWQDAHLRNPRALPRAATAGDANDAAAGAPLQRGDWIEVQGLGLCCVVRVHERGSSWRADVERASDLATRSVDLRRQRWKRVERH